MTGNHCGTKYSLTILAEYDNEDEVILLDVTSDSPFLSVGRGDTIHGRSLKPGDLEVPPKPHLFDGELTVIRVTHNIFEFYDDGPMLHHGVTVVVKDPYED